MAAEKGNKYHQKWTPETIGQEVQDLIDLMKGKQEIKSERFLFLGTLLTAANEAKDENKDKTLLYTDIWAYWKRITKHEKKEGEPQSKFDMRMQVFRLIKRVETQLESNLLESGIRMKTSTALTIFTLKNRHSWTDEQKVDVTSEGESVNGFAPKVVIKVIQPDNGDVLVDEDSLTFDEDKEKNDEGK